MAEPRARTPEPDGRVRAVIESVTPSVDCGRHAVKRIAGDQVVVEADCFADGHDVVRAVLGWRAEGATAWEEVDMAPLGNDRWRAAFVAGAPGRYRYRVCAWVDAFDSWHHDMERREDPEDIAIAARVGAALAEAAAARATGSERKQLAHWAKALAAQEPTAKLRALALDPAMALLARRHPDRALEQRTQDFPLAVDRERARFSTWYELFPRSAAAKPGGHGTFRDVAARLPYVADMGFDVLYLPPIHPIGRDKRKGRNNAVAAKPGDVGSPWAIGAREGGHTALHPDLGTLEDFRALVAATREHGMELALDIAYQCAPDHPWVAEHPDWFRQRPDGSIQYAENPPKRYQDIYPFDFESRDWKGLWAALKGVIDFWIAEGVRIFRVDNPHTKAFPFWEWAIAEVKRDHPDVLFLAEAFTRPRVMHRLAKIGFSQSYTYFTWRNTRAELTAYFTELVHGPGRDYFRPNVWPNTPDILPEPLQHGGRPMYLARLVLAATLCPSYGIYGPAFELMESTPRDPGSEEYRDSEKYEIRAWDLARADSLAPFIARVNRIRHANPALQSAAGLAFIPTDNDQLLAYARTSADGENTIVAVVNLDPRNAHSGWLQMDLAALGLPGDRGYQMHDLLTDARFLWQGPRNYVHLDPQRVPAHVFHVRRHVHREQDFDYFL